jgi:carboxylesterase type B
MTIGGRELRSTHGVDIALTFNPFADPDSELPPMSTHPGAAELAHAWVAMIGAFVRTGDPNGPLGSWPAYDEKDRSVLLVSPGASQVLHDPDPEFRTKVWR